MEAAEVPIERGPIGHGRPEVATRPRDVEQRSSVTVELVVDAQVADVDEGHRAALGVGRHGGHRRVARTVLVQFRAHERELAHREAAGHGGVVQRTGAVFAEASQRDVADERAWIDGLPHRCSGSSDDGGDRVQTRQRGHHEPRSEALDGRTDPHLRRLEARVSERGARVGLGTRAEKPKRRVPLVVRGETHTGRFHPWKRGENVLDGRWWPDGDEQAGHGRRKLLRRTGSQVRDWSTMHVRPLLQTTDEQFAAAVAVQQRAEQAFDPDVPPTTAEELRLLATHDRSSANRHERYVVLDAAQPRAVCHLEFELDDANAHLASTEIFGAAQDHDAGRAGLAAMLDLVESDDRTSLLGWGPQLPAEAAFWEGLGADLRYRERFSVLDVAAVDADLMASWIHRRHERAADVRLVRFVDRCPDEHLDAWTASRSAMSDAPMEDLDINDTVYDAADIREDEASALALGYRMMHLLALTPAGAPVGHTTVRVNTHRPAASDQWDTVVLAEHRRRGIGRWLKAEMWRWLRDAEPHVTRLGTGNAQSNDPMLAINVAMGYVPLCAFGAWQAPVDEIRSRLD